MNNIIIFLFFVEYNESASLIFVLALFFFFYLIAPAIVLPIVLVNHHKREKDPYYIERNRRRKENIANGRYITPKTHLEKMGMYGENSVNGKLTKFVLDYNWFLIENVLLPDGNKNTAQIDHILICPHGVFVIETKNYKGIISGDLNNKHLKHRYTKFGKNYSIYNPVMQNKRHTEVVRRILRQSSIDYAVFSLVVVFGAVVEGEIKKHIQTIDTLLPAICSKTPDKSISYEELKNCFNIFAHYCYNPVSTVEAHIERVQKKHPKREPKPHVRRRRRFRGFF